MELKYDKSDPNSIYEYGKKLLGHTFKEIYDWDLSDIDVELEDYLSGSIKGGLATLIEEQYFCYKRNNTPEADFPEAGVELKVSPYEITKKGLLTAGERTVLCMIPNDVPVEIDFYKSHVWEKCKLILLIYYLRNRELLNKEDYHIDFVNLFTPPEKDMDIILNDYKIIIDKIASGDADKISESDTMYLGACTKGQTAEKSLQPQYYGDKLAKRRAYCFKRSYMTYILRNYLSGENKNQESLIDNPKELKNKTFEEILKDKVKRYIGKTDRELAGRFNIPINKSLWSRIAFNILGITSNQAEELQKAEITVKAIRIEANGKIKESSSLETFAFKDIIKKEWEDSDIYDYFETKKFLYIVFKKEIKNDKTYTLKGCQLWNMPFEDLNDDVKECWEKTVNIIKSGVKITKEEKNGNVIFHNNLPNKADNKVLHVRPHSNQRYYKLEDGIEYGNKKDGNELPDGRWMTTQSFFINNDYILSQLDDDLKL